MTIIIKKERLFSYLHESRGSHDNTRTNSVEIGSEHVFYMGQFERIRDVHKSWWSGSMREGEREAHGGRENEKIEMTKQE